MKPELQIKTLSRVVGMFDKPIIQNNFRGVYVECLVAELLGADWGQTADWAGWDFCHTDGTRLEVKQTARRQTWDNAETVSNHSRSFSIRKPAGYYDGPSWVKAEGRLAQIYVFAWHGKTKSSSDQRDPQQWEFFVLSESKLPDQSSISVNQVRKLCDPVSYEDVRSAAEKLRQQGVLQ